MRTRARSPSPCAHAQVHERVVNMEGCDIALRDPKLSLFDPAHADGEYSLDLSRPYDYAVMVSTAVLGSWVCARRLSTFPYS